MIGTRESIMESFKSNPPLGKRIFPSRIFLFGVSPTGKCGTGKWATELRANDFLSFTLIIFIVLLLYFPAQAQQRRARPSAQPNKAQGKTQANFDQLKAQADEAREA